MENNISSCFLAVDLLRPVFFCLLCNHPTATLATALVLSQDDVRHALCQNEIICDAPFYTGTTGKQQFPVTRRDVHAYVDFIKAVILLLQFFYDILLYRSVQGN